MDKVEGYLEVRLDDEGQIIIKQVGNIVFSPNQALNLAELLGKHADEARCRQADLNARVEAERRKAAEAIPVDYTARTMIDGSPETPDHRETDPVTGMQKGYIVLSAAERAKGFVRPVRRSYVHKPCGTLTTMGLALAETYARCPTFYSGTFCCGCRAHFPLTQYVWEGTGEVLGS